MENQTREIKKEECLIDEKDQVFNEKTKKFKTKKISDETKKTKKNDDILETEKLSISDDSNQAANQTKKEKIKISELLDSLDKQTRIYYYFLLIITFGFIRNTIISRIEDNTENVIKTSTKIPFNIVVFIHALGGKDNIIDVSSTISSVKITLKNIDLVNKEEIKEISQRGILVSENKITILFGDFSETLKNVLQEEINKQC